MVLKWGVCHQSVAQDSWLLWEDVESSKADEKAFHEAQQYANTVRKHLPIYLLMDRDVMTHVHFLKNS